MRLAVIGAVVLVVLAVALFLALSRGGSSTSAITPTKPSTQPAIPANRCPLTDLPAPGGHVPQREPIAVKIGNEPGGARPQSGLNEADVVYDTPAEGFIMRYIAIYQCNSASDVGPVRSVRWVDWHILAEFRHVALAYVGGVQPNQQAVASMPWIDNANEFVHYNLFHNDPNRTAPDATYTSTDAIWRFFPSHAAPAPIFRYDTSLPADAKPASSVSIDFSAGTDVVWKWDPATGEWLHTYGGVQDVDALTNQPVAATNVVVEIVHYTYGPYIESPGGTGDVESVTVGKGPGYIMRDGKIIPVIWRRANLSSPTAFSDVGSGDGVGLAPGRTWVEILPDTIYNEPGHFVVTP